MAHGMAATPTAVLAFRDPSHRLRLRPCELVCNSDMDFVHCTFKLKIAHLHTDILDLPLRERLLHFQLCSLEWAYGPLLL